jgi:hypothetical protein
MLFTAKPLAFTTMAREQLVLVPQLFGPGELRSMKGKNYGESRNWRDRKVW